MQNTGNDNVDETCLHCSTAKGNNHLITTKATAMINIVVPVEVVIESKDEINEIDLQTLVQKAKEKVEMCMTFSVRDNGVHFDLDPFWEVQPLAKKLGIEKLKVVSNE